MDCFEYTKESLRRIQLIELEILKEVDCLCRKNNINYIIDSGTLLGAIRHGGFIPWDDDIDIRMLRDDYDRFCKICESQLDEKYFLQTHETDEGYRWRYARVLKANTVFLRKDHEEIKSKNGIFIDIFPSDNLPETFWNYRLCTCLSWICRKMLYSEVGRVHAGTVIRRLGFQFLDMFPKKWAHLMFDYIIKKYKHTKTQKVRCFAWGSKDEAIGLKKEWLENTCDIEFEGIMVRAPKKCHEVLVHYYGEAYMTPPPEKDRKPGHEATYIDFGEG